MLKHKHNEFPSDAFIVLETVRAQIIIGITHIFILLTLKSNVLLTFLGLNLHSSESSHRGI